MAKDPKLIRLLAIIGCILAIIGAAVGFGLGWWSLAMNIIGGIIIIVLAIFVLANKGLIPLKKKILPDTWIVTLIVGIVIAILGHWLAEIGGILLIVSALLDHFT